MIMLDKPEGEQMALVQPDVNISSAFLILTERREDSGTFYTFPDEPDRNYPVVGLYRPPELCGIDESKGVSEEYRSKLRADFITALRRACSEANVETLFLAGAELWSGSVYQKLYPEIIVDDAQNKL